MNNDTHAPPLYLPYGFGTQGRWSFSPERKLIVFVHGFKGAAGGTWGRIPELLLMRQETAGYDFVSFGYESVVQTASESANQLHAFLNDLLINQQKVVNQSFVDFYDPAFQRKANWNYERMVLVGHSLGACVIRRALLDHLRAGTVPWPKRTKLIWFAPAHGGARLFRLWALVTLGLSLDGVDKIAAYFSPVLNDLAEESNFLRRLEEQTEELSQKHEELIAPLTFSAWKDKVVINETFAKDIAPYIEIRNVNHVSICKPASYDKRTEMLLRELIK